MQTQQYHSAFNLNGIPRQSVARHGHFGREQTTTGPNMRKPASFNLMPFYPLEKGKVVYAVS